MIEIGRDSRMSLVFRRIAGIFGGLSALLALVWLIRGPLGIQSSSTTLLLTAFRLFFAAAFFGLRLTQEQAEH